MVLPHIDLCADAVGWVKLKGARLRSCQLVSLLARVTFASGTILMVCLTLPIDNYIYIIYTPESPGDIVFT